MNTVRLFVLAVATRLALVACDQGTPRVVTVSNNTEKPSRYLRETAVTGPIRVLLAPAAIAGASGYVNETLAVMEKSVRQDHPIFESLTHEANRIAREAESDDRAAFLSEQSEWDPFQFVDLCQQGASGPKALKVLCQEIAVAEWKLLFDFCYQSAIG